LFALACGKLEPEQLPPLGEVVVSLDTDAPVPAFVSRLRIDVFDEDGRWLTTRDQPRAQARDFPTSFSLYTRDENTPQRVLVRARAYLDGRERDYQGEQFQDNAPYVEPATASTLGELCANLPELELGKDLTLRRGARTLTGFVRDESPPGASEDYPNECWAQLVGGVVAATLNVTRAAEYRIETTRVDPLSADPNLFIRRTCRDPLTQLACNDDIARDDAAEGAYAYDYRSRLVVQLEPGSYTVMSGSYLPDASDVTLRADLSSHWTNPTDTPKGVTRQGLPRLLDRDGADVTPGTEPEPRVTIDRLALLTLVPGEKQRASIVLRTACAGTMAKLSAAGSDSPLVPSEAATCVDTEGQRVPLVPEVQMPAQASTPPSAVGSATLAEPCPSGASPQGAICVPGGLMVLGSPVYLPYPLSTTPERFALMHRYWLDETEVTVGRWRAALAKGFTSPNLTPIANDRPLASDFDGEYLQHCTFSTAARSGEESRETFPLDCVDWRAARAFCRFSGGDLPTEAQWQYAATVAGRVGEVEAFCTGDSEVTCLAEQINVVSVDDPLIASDVTPLGLKGLLGNVAEWSLDSFQPLDGPCWNGASLVDPVCWEVNAPQRTVSGSDFTTTRAGWRRPSSPSGRGTSGNGLIWSALGDAGFGFRCAYPEEPR
jgi:formylglycine-generating enzyme required for sulfatase activity